MENAKKYVKEAFDAETGSHSLMHRVVLAIIYGRK